MKHPVAFPDFTQIKATTDIIRVVESYGIVLKKAGTDDHVGLCPFHEEKTPSFHVSPSKNLFHCFGCHAKGNVIQFVAKKEGVTDKEAAHKLLGAIPGVTRGDECLTPHATGGTQASSVQREACTVEQDRALFSALIAHYHESLFSRDRRGLDYLKSRGLGDLEMLKHFHIGFVNGTVKKNLSLAQVKAAQALGLFNAEGNEKFYLRVVVPIFSEEGQPVGLCGRDITDKFDAKYLYLSGEHRAVWNGLAAAAYPDELIVTESIFDALAIWKAEKKNVIASYGTCGWTAHHTALVQKHAVKKVVIAYDNDAAGDKGTIELSEKLNAPGIRVHRLHWPDGIKDAIDYFQYTKAIDFKGTAETFSSLLAVAPRIGFSRVANPRLSLVEKTDESALFQNGSIAYRVKGLSNNGNMRLVLSASRNPSTGSGHGPAVHTDHFDLYASKGRSAFSARCAERFSIEATKVEEDLLSLVEHIEKLKEESSRLGGTASAAKPSMSESEKDEALALLKSPKLLERVASDLDLVGYVGEKRNKELAYLIATSRRLPKPLSGIFRSQSGAGKSFLMECVADLMPPEDVHYFSRLTPQALYYLEADALTHRLLIVDERSGSEESEYPIRTLQTRKKLKLAAPIKDPSTGKIKTVVLEINGPIAYMESTTDQKINPENANRCFELYLDESEEQTRAIFAAQRRTRSLNGWKAEQLRGKTLAIHHNAQRLLRSLKVIIPYVELIEFPASWLRGRRDNDRLLSLIEGVAFLHQYQRRIAQENGHDYIEASLEDYAFAYDLAHQVFAQAASDLPKPVAEFQMQIENVVNTEARKQKREIEDFWFTRRMIREAMKLPDHLIKRYMQHIEELEYVQVQRAASGGSFRYRLLPLKKNPAVLEGLITPQALAQKWKAEQAEQKRK